MEDLVLIHKIKIKIYNLHPDKNPELNRLAVIVNQAKDVLIKNTI
jgi:hypothetical protein